MYSKPPNLVIGFHGCDLKVFESVIYNAEPLLPSTNDYDWLGKGIYFWEQNLERAKEWASDRTSIQQPAVIGAIIDLGHCLNLMDSEYINLLKEEHTLLCDEFQELELPLPKNSGGTKDEALRRLDCAVVEHLHTRKKRSAQGIPALRFCTGPLLRGGANL